MERKNTRQTVALQGLLQQVEQYEISIIALQEPIWQEIYATDTRTHRPLYTEKDGGNNEPGVAFLILKYMKENTMNFTVIKKKY